MMVEVMMKHLKDSTAYRLDGVFKLGVDCLEAKLRAGEELARCIRIRRRNELFGDEGDLGQALIAFENAGKGDSDGGIGRS